MLLYVRFHISMLYNLLILIIDLCKFNVILLYFKMIYTLLLLSTRRCLNDFSCFKKIDKLKNTISILTFQKRHATSFCNNFISLNNLTSIILFYMVEIDHSINTN